MQLDEDDRLTGGWSCERKHGKNHGHKHIAPFRKEVEEMFVAGIDDISKRLGPGRMLAQLKKRHPSRFDLPSENEIRQTISTLANTQKKGKNLTLVSNRRVMVEPFLSTTMEIAQQYPALKPEEA